MIEPIEVTTTAALYDLKRYSIEVDATPMLVHSLRAYYIIDDGAFAMEVEPRRKNSKASIFFMFDDNNPSASKATKFDGALDFMAEKGYHDIATWFLFNVGLFA